MELLALLSVIQSGLAAFKNSDGISIFLNAMDGSNVTDNAFLLNGCRILNCLSVDPDARRVVQSNNGVRLLLGLMVVAKRF